MPKKFQKRVQDFRCENCKKLVEGNGFTNHCPKCLWSKHVDVNPGDREEFCHGLMKPVRVEGDPKEYVLVHKCEECGVEKRNKVSVFDDFEEVIKIAGAAGREL